LRSVYSSANRRVGTSQHNVKSQKRFKVDVQSQRQPDARSTMVQRRRTDFGGQEKDSIQKVIISPSTNACVRPTML